jgi:hypothetical protein
LTLDSLAAEIIAISPEEPAQRLAKYLMDWKSDDTSVEALNSGIEKVIGFTWFSTDEVHNQIYKLWATFRESSIQGISGMTMNERLWCFGLTTRFDSAKTENARKVIYDKLLARA